MERPTIPDRFGPHCIVSPLSLGSSTDVLLAVTRGPFGFTRPVVLKCLRPSVADDPGRRRALAREAMAYARLSHPAIVRLYEFFEHEGQAVLVLEHVPGVSLGALVAHLHLVGTTLEPAVAYYIMANVFDALAAAHAARDPATGEFASVIHRDVSPKNVLLDWEGNVKLGDFGIAKLAGVSGDTQSGVLKGTYGYMAPEQVLGDPTTVRTDLYAACLVMRELLVGRRTFTRGTLSELELLQAMATPDLAGVESLVPGIPVTVARMLATGLRPNPDQRDLSCDEARDLLLGYVDPTTARARLARLMDALQPGRVASAPEQAEVTQPAEEPSTLRWARNEDGSTTEVAPVRPPPVRRPAPVPGSALVLPSPSPLSRATPTSIRPVVVVPTAPSAFRTQAARASRRRGPLPWGLLAAALALSFVALRLTVGEPAGAAHAGRADAGRPPQSAISSGATVARLDVTTGTLQAVAALDAHRIYVDGKVIGESGQLLTVRCGHHLARFGSRGRLQEVDVPCGGAVTLAPRW